MLNRAHAEVELSHVRFLIESEIIKVKNIKFKTHQSEGLFAPRLPDSPQFCLFRFIRIVALYDCDDFSYVKQSKNG